MASCAICGATNVPLNTKGRYKGYLAPHPDARNPDQTCPASNTVASDTGEARREIALLEAKYARGPMSQSAHPKLTPEDEQKLARALLSKRGDSMSKIRVCQNIRAPNDSNGNPQRLWIEYEVQQPGEIENAARVTKVLDEGYEGPPEWCPWQRQLPEVFVQAKEYKRLKKFLAAGSKGDR